MINKELINGVIAATFTPMLGNGDINLKQIGQYARYLISSKVSGAFVCGTTGEGLSLTTGERKLVLEEWIKCSNGKLKIISHVGGNCLPQSIELAAHAEKCGAYAIAAFSPSFFKPATVKELVSFLKPVAASAPKTPFYFYHFPSLTGVSLPVIELMEEADKSIPTFAGVKFTHFDLYDMQQCIAYGNGKFEILSGYDEILLCSLSLGIKSTVGSTYNYMPSVYLDLWDAYNHFDMKKAREFQLFSVKIVQILNKYGGGVRAGKAIMELIGIDCGPCRLPIRKFTDDEKAALKKDLTDVGFIELLNAT